LVSIQAFNNFGASYAGSVDGTPMSCHDDRVSGYLTCSFPITTPHSSSETGPFYGIQFTMQDASGVLVPHGSYSYAASPDSFASCTGGSPTAGESRLSASAFCGADGRPYLNLAPNTPTHYSQVTVGNPSHTLTFSDPAHACVSTPSRTVCPLFDPGGVDLSGTSVQGSTSGLTLDGATPLHSTFSGVSVPTCSSKPTSQDPVALVTPLCSDLGVSSFKLASDPPGSLVFTGVADERGLSVSCSETAPDSWVCSAPAADSDGQARIQPAASLTSHPEVGVTLPIQSFPPAVCPSTGQSQGKLSFGLPTCRPDGLPGSLVRVTYTGPGSAVSLHTRSAGASSACSPASATDHSFQCELPIPLPGDLEFCLSPDGTNETCTPNPIQARDLPVQCGGSQGKETWSAAGDCQGNLGYDVRVNISLGRNVAALSSTLGGTSSDCSADPAMANSFDCAFSSAILGQAPSFHATFVDGSSQNHTFPDLSSSLPQQCPGKTPFGGTCAQASSSASDWHNNSLAQDVNADGCVTPIDVLILINQINSTHGGPLPATRPEGANLVDVNGDGSLSAMDVLSVITYMNSHTGETCTPSSCASGTTPQPTWQPTIAFSCVNGTNQITVRVDSTSVDTLSVNGTTLPESMCSNRGTSLVVCLLPQALNGTNVNLSMTGLDSARNPVSWSGATNIPDCNGSTPTPTFQPVGPPAPTCSDNTNPNTCGSAGCNWWYSTNTCHSGPEPQNPTNTPAPFSCGDYSGNESKCSLVGCNYWSDGTCSSKPQPKPTCSNYKDQKTCQANSCSWNSKSQSCN
jgi:hypothetical protein